MVEIIQLFSLSLAYFDAKIANFLFNAKLMEKILA